MEVSLERWRLGDPHLLDEAQAHLQIKDILLLIQEYYPPSITWNEEQERALALMDGHKSLFLSGEAGTGKSRLVREMIRRSQQSGIKFAITASMGLPRCRSVAVPCTRGLASGSGKKMLILYAHAFANTKKVDGVLRMNDGRKPIAYLSTR